MVIPVYNEEDNIVQVLAGLPLQVGCQPLTAIVIDDGSQDATAERVREAGFSVVSGSRRRGSGAALRTGFGIARDRGAEIVVTMDGDGQHLGTEIERLVTPILEDRFDFVIGSRLLAVCRT